MTAYKIRPEKKAIVGEVSGRLKEASFVILVDGRGLNVAKSTDLRGQLGEVDAGFQVVRNTYLGVAAEEVGIRGLSILLEGPTAVISGSGDVSRVAKKLKTFITGNNTLPKIKGGWMAGRVLTAADVQAIADIPPRPILLGQLVGTIAAPMTRLVGVMNQKVASVLYVLKAVMDKKAGQN